MAIRPPRRAASRTTDRATSALPRVPAADAVSFDAAQGRADESGQGAEEKHKKAVLDTFEASLRGQPSGVEGEALDFVVGHMRKVVSEAQFQPGLAAPDRNTWVETLEALVQNGLLAEEDRETLIRQFGEATSPLQNRDVQIALELAQRIERDGEEKAMEWLASQRPGDADTGTAGKLADGTVDVVGKQAITRSRSRRLRGPPGSA